MRARIKERLYHTSLYLIAAVILLAAIAVTVVRLTLPNISQYKGQVEAWAESYMEYPVAVDSISAEWQGWTPSLLLTGVHLRSRDGGRDIIGFDTATVEVSPLMSLWKLSPVPRRIVIAGLDVSVSRLADGTLLVQGININPDQSEQENEFVKWLFGQDSIEVQDTTITWTDHKHRQAAVEFSGVSLLIRTDGARSQVTGEMNLPGKYGEKMSFALDATGELWSSDWSGEIYASTTQFNPDSWYREYRPERLTPAGGSADLELWSAWEQARPVLVQGRLAYRDFVVLTSAKTLNVSALGARFTGRKLPDRDWHFSLKLDRMETENGAWPVANIEFVVPREAGRRYALGFDYLNLADLAPLAPDLEFIPEAAGRMLENASISGELLNGLVVHDRHPDAEQVLVYNLAFRNLDASLGPDRPAAGIRSGRLRGTDSRAGITMNGTGAEFSIPGLYANELVFSNLDGSLSWMRTEQGWVLHTDDLFMENRDMSLAVRGSAAQDGGRASPYLDMIAEIRSERLENMYRYMPYTDKFRIREWMERSLHAGYVDSAIAAIRGYPDEFPFRNNNGSMRGVVNLSRSIVEYSQQWPAVDNADAEIFFHNELMTARISRASVFGAQVTGATGAIEDLTRRPKVVLLKGKVKGPEKDLEAYIQQSPLAGDRIIRYANQSLVAGNFTMDLDMSIPIKAPQLQSVINGTLNLEDARLVSDAGNLELEQVNGTVGFTRDSVDGRGLTAVFAGQPVTLAMTGSRNTPETPPAFVISGRSTDDVIMQQVTERFPGAAHFASRLGERISGSADWQARFIFEQDAQALRQRLELESDLYGLALDLPRPLWKPTYGRKQLVIRKTLGEPGPTELVYDDDVSARLHTRQDTSLERLDIALGNGFRSGPAGAGVNLTGRTGILLFDEWRDAIAFFAREQGDGNGFFSSANINMELETGLLNVLNQSFKDSSMQASRRNGDWRVAFQGKSLEGEMFLPKRPSPENRIEVNLDKLAIKKTGDGRSAGEADPGNLPPVRAEIADFTYGDYHLGSMKLSTTPTANGLSFEEIGFETPEMTINGTGLWEKPFNRNKSYFTIDLKARKLHKMLAAFGYDDSAIKADKTEISIDAAWDGAPDEFSLDKLAGTFDIRVKKGQLLEVSPAAGRLFGLLSIQTLPRRLTLDFTDLFGKGLAFDKITGSFNIANGNAYTNDLHLTGPSADVLISGRTGLADQDYDQLVTVTPQFANNLPIASALLGPVGIGVGAVLYLADNMFGLIDNNINKMLSYQYTITGNWHDPKIEKVKDPAEDKQVKAPGTSQLRNP
ncbi:MAG: YhdP family protein [Gammaproteobacteria bacterium]|nr:YhdP family protein [Gammaproteobacteria bacterium]